MDRRDRPEEKKNIVAFPGKRERRKILRQQEDRRVRVVYVLRRLTGAALLLTLILFFAAHPQLLRPESIRRTLSYLTLSVTGEGDGEMDRIDFAAGGYQAAVPFAGGLAVADGGLLTIQRPGGVTDLSVSLSLSNPVLLTSDQYLFAYDPGGTRVLVADSFGLADEINLGAPVTHLAVNGEGMMAAVSGESGYRGAVTVFNRQREQAYKWYTSEYYIMCAALSPDGRQMAAGVFTQTGVELTGRLLVFRLDEEEPVADVPLGDTVPMQLAFQDNDTLIAVGDAGAAVVDVPDGSVTHTVSYATGELEGCSLTADGCLLAVHSYGGEAAQRLVLLTGEGESRLDLTRGADSVALSPEYLAVLTGSRVTVYDRSFAQVYRQELESGVRQLLQREDGVVYALYQDSAQVITPWAENTEE